MEDLVSVVVSVYNIEAFLPKCLESLFFQTYRNIEIILIDDGSTDDSGRICDDYASRDNRALVIHQENQGLWAVRNKGQKESKGKYLIFPDGDDYFHRDYIRLLYEAINYGGKQHPLAICGYRDTNGDEADVLSEIQTSFTVLERSQLLDKITTIPSCGEAYWGANWNKLYRKSALPVPFQHDYLRCQDYDSNLRLFFSIESAVVVDSSLYYWRGHPRQTIKDTQYNQIRNDCRTRIFLDVLSNSSSRVSDYKPKLLIALYTRLVLWADASFGSKQERISRQTIRKAEKQTIVSFLFCRKISLSLKAHLLFALHRPKRRFFSRDL